MLTVARQRQPFIGDRLPQVIRLPGAYSVVVGDEPADVLASILLRLTGRIPSRVLGGYTAQFGPDIRDLPVSAIPVLSQSVARVSRQVLRLLLASADANVQTEALAVLVLPPSVGPSPSPGRRQDIVHFTPWGEHANRSFVGGGRLC